MKVVQVEFAPIVVVKTLFHSYLRSNHTDEYAGLKSHISGTSFWSNIQKDLDSVVECWNSHRIRPSGRDTIPGISDELYSFPEIIGANNMLLPIDREDIEEMDGFLDDNISFGIDDMEERFVEYCKYIRQYEDQVLPQNWFTAKLGHGKIGSRQNLCLCQFCHMDKIPRATQSYTFIV